jgi:pimeloyl-ACP methyl ester carboxylesterase
MDPSGYGVRIPGGLRVVRWPLVGPLVAALRGRWITGRILRSTYGDPTRVTQADIDQYYAPVAEPDFGRVLRGVLRQYRFDALVGRLPSLQVPTLVLWGARDRVIPAAVGRRFALAVPRVGFVVIPGAGHALPEEAPAEATRLLLAFLAEGVPHVSGDLARR